MTRDQIKELVIDTFAEFDNEEFVKYADELGEWKLHTTIQDMYVTLHERLMDKLSDMTDEGKFDNVTDTESALESIRKIIQ